MRHKARRERERVERRKRERAKVEGRAELLRLGRAIHANAPDACTYALAMTRMLGKADCVLERARKARVDARMASLARERDARARAFTLAAVLVALVVLALLLGRAVGR